MKDELIMRVREERGIAIVIALFLMTAMSVLGVSLMFLSQTETFASMNYRMMSQARYGGEAAIHKAANFLLDSAQYAVPEEGSSTDPLSNYDYTVSPVTFGGQPVVLSATDGVESNYPVTAVEAAFAAAATGTLGADNVTVDYAAYATLIHMQKFDALGGTQSVVQTWQITGTGSVTGSRTATVEVTAVVERPKVPGSSYGAFATDDTCGALNFSGNVVIDSYDSSGMVGGTVPTLDEEGGDVGTNGNMTIGGSVEVQGNLYTPRAGVGDCTAGAVTALSESGSADVAGSVVQLPTAVLFPTPEIPSPSTLPEAHLASTTGACALLGLTLGTNCTESGNDVIIDGGGSTLSLPSVILSGNTNIRLVAGSPPSEYNFNSLTIVAGSEIGAQATAPTEGVLVNIVGQDNTGTEISNPLDMTGGSYGAVTGCASCSVYDASILQFVYGGTGDITLQGNSGASATFYAPNANAELVGTADIYGSILAARLDQTGTGNIHYDKQLQEAFWVAGQPMMGTFTWNRY